MTLTTPQLNTWLSEHQNHINTVSDYQLIRKNAVGPTQNPKKHYLLLALTIIVSISLLVAAFVYVATNDYFKSDLNCSPETICSNVTVHPTNCEKQTCICDCPKSPDCELECNYPDKLILEIKNVTS